MRGSTGERALLDAESPDERSVMIAERIREAQVIAARGPTAGSALLVPERGPRTAVAWLAELRQLVGHDSYRRRASPIVTELWQAVEDANQDGVTRAGAAAALSPLLDDDGRNRLRIAAEATAAPRLRAAFEAAAAADEKQLASALAALEAPSARRASPSN
jgi:hypothetical protein